MPSIALHLFLPQMRLSIDELVERAQAAEEAGFEGIALMDHLAPPLAAHHPMYEAMTAATWLAAHTSTLTIGHLVLCDAFRHPAVLAKQAVTLDHASSGRFELGIGWGSVAEELVGFDVTTDGPRQRVERLERTLRTLRHLWSGEGGQQPVPLDRIPILIGGAGKRTMALVAEHADWWNLPSYGLDRLDELRPQAGRARVTIQELVTFAPDPARRAEVVALADKRFGRMGRRIATGDGPELVAHFTALAERGVERAYCWFTDFADPAQLPRFGEDVLSRLP